MSKDLCVDLDGTILTFDGWKGEEWFGEPLPGARKALKALKDDGWTIIIHTCRENRELIAKTLNKYDIPFDAINLNPKYPESKGKPYGDYYVDDHGVRFENNWQEILIKLLYQE